MPIARQNSELLINNGSASWCKYKVRHLTSVPSSPLAEVLSVIDWNSLSLKWQNSNYYTFLCLVVLIIYSKLFVTFGRVRKFSNVTQWQPSPSSHLAVCLEIACSLEKNFHFNLVHMWNKLYYGMVLSNIYLASQYLNSLAHQIKLVWNSFILTSFS